MSTTRTSADRQRVAAEKVAREVVARLCSYYNRAPVNVTRQFYLVADIADQLVAVHAAGVRAGQERMRDESASIALVPLMNAATTYDPAKGERPICYDCTRGVAKALELYRAAIRALPLEEPE